MPGILYYAEYSPPCQAVLLLMKYLNITDIELKIVNTHNGEQNSPDYVKKNPQHTIPFYEENGFYVSESRAIIQYLVDSRAPESGLLGRFAKKRALIQQRIQFELGTLLPRTQAAVAPLFSGSATTIADADLEKIKDAIAIIDTYLSNSSYIAGDSITIADFSYIATIVMFQAVGFPIKETYPNIGKWLKRCSKLPGYEENETLVKGTAAFVSSKLTEPLHF